MADTWSQLSLYESHDLVRNFFTERHGRQLSQEKAYEIIANISQGRSYFESARQASDLVRPLLLYYGVLSLSRGLILFRDVTARRASLQPSHGLSHAHWKSDLSERIDTLTDREILITTGTFPELCRVTANTERAVVMGSRLGESVLWTRSGTSDLKARTSVSVRDLLKRLPEVMEIYERTFEEASACNLSDVRVQIARAFGDSPAAFTFTFDVHRSARFEVHEDRVRELFKLAPTDKVDMHLENPEQAGCKATVRIFCQTKDHTEHIAPEIYEGRDGHTFLIGRIADDVRLAQLSRLYLVSYFMGMLVRYYPSHWLAMVTKRKGDLALPLLTAALRVVETRVPELILRELEPDAGTQVA